LSKDITLTSPDFKKFFEIYTDASKVQLGAVIEQEGKPLAFYSRKLSDAQTHCTVTELELVSIGDVTGISYNPVGSYYKGIYGP
jgi:RNase H-like domain found in reverse transcriptase